MFSVFYSEIGLPCFLYRILHMHVQTLFQCVVILQDPGGQQIGFLLGSLSISVALTSESTGKALPKEDGKDNIVHFKGWPRLTWFVTEHLPKPPKDWAPPQRPQPDTPAYIEVMLLPTQLVVQYYYDILVNAVLPPHYQTLLFSYAVFISQGWICSWSYCD